jgi:hypothetical protein
MTLPLGKMTPTIALFSLVSYCCWTELDPPASSGPTKSDEKQAEITVGMLTPGSTPAPDRNPFQTTSLSKADEKPRDAKVSGLLSDKKDAKATAAQLTKPPPQLMLKGTFIQGTRRVALINDRVYAEGETLTAIKTDPGSLVLAQVHPDKVLLQQGTQRFELKYTSRESKAAASPQPSLNRPGPGSKSDVPRR